MDITENIENIIEEPIHGRKFYTDDNIITLKRKLIEIYERINLEKLEEKDIIKYIGDFVKNNVKYKKSYFDSFTGKVEKFDYSDVKYRTAYGALVEGEAMCAGYAEAIRILLSLYNIKSFTILSKLPLERKKLLHYVVAIKCNCDGEYIILDPESEQYCEKNKIDYEEYKEKCIYMLSDKIFTNNVLGKDGAGMLAEEYLKNIEIPRVIGTKKIENLIENIEKMDSVCR